ncbi:MAG: hypothetical protein Q7R81_05535 [Candidatus Peregrinibacteria bacterium]|nr:hypothetical protein [Candidatus Peregrinibacteria bacterium]
MTITQSSFEQLLSAILLAASLTDEEKKAMLQEIGSGKISPELIARLQQFLAKEMEVAKAEIQQLDSDIALQDRLINEEVVALGTDIAEEMEEADAKFQMIQEAFAQDCISLERHFDKSVEGDVRSDEKNAADDIRQSLKQPPPPTAQ